MAENTYIVAVNKRSSIDKYCKELKSKGITFERMKRFKRLLKVTCDDPNRLPSQDRITSINAFESVEGDALPVAESIDQYDPTPPTKQSAFKKVTEKLFGAKQTTQSSINDLGTIQSVQKQQITFSKNNASKSDNWGLARISRKQNDFKNKYPYKSDYKYKVTGENVDVYVVDSGVDDHPELEDRLTHLFGNKGDDNGHGTHVATTIAGKKYGVAKDASVYNVCVLGDNGVGSPNVIIDGLEAVLEHHQDKENDRPSVVNMSLGGQASKNGPMAAAVDELVENGVIVLASAGNDGVDLGKPTEYIPAEVESAITVGAITISDDRANFSNWGEAVDIWAPGHQIVAGYPNNQIGSMSGTSMATPIVAGIVAQLVSKEGKFTSRTQVREIRQQLIENAVDDKVKWINKRESISPNHLAYMGDTR